MEVMLEVSPRPYDPARPVVCLDELRQPWVAEIRTPLPAEPGQPERVADDYERCGTANRFMTSAPLAGRGLLIEVSSIRHLVPTGRFLPFRTVASNAGVNF